MYYLMCHEDILKRNVSQVEDRPLYLADEGIGLWVPAVEVTSEIHQAVVYSSVEAAEITAARQHVLQPFGVKDRIAVVDLAFEVVKVVDVERLERYRRLVLDTKRASRKGRRREVSLDVMEAGMSDLVVVQAIGVV
jgi:hypothetical protein